jgi:hypothetical protein
MAVISVNVVMLPFQQDILTGEFGMALWIVMLGVICFVDVRRLWLFR